jgi:hypothetical protein
MLAQAATVALATTRPIAIAARQLLELARPGPRNRLMCAVSFSEGATRAPP